MRSFNRVGIIENSRRVALLARYSNDVVEYFNHVEHGFLGRPVGEDGAACAARRRINLETDEVCDVIHSAGIATTMRYAPPPAVGGYVQSIELVHNVFNLFQFEAPPQMLIDMVERAQGVYQRNHRAAIVRTFNPFFYIGLALDAVARSPFRLATRLGLPGGKLEDSVVGVVVRLVVYLVGAMASLIAVLGFLGYLDQARLVVTRWFGI